MTDSIPDKQKKSHSDVADKKIGDNLEKIALELEEKGKKNDRSSVLNKELFSSQGSEPLDAFLEFDAQIFASKAAGTEEVNIVDELSETADHKNNQQTLDSVDKVIKTKGAPPADTALTKHDIDQQSGYRDPFKDVNYNDRISKLETTVLTLHKRFESQSDVIKDLSHQYLQLKKINIILVVVMLILLGNIYFGVFNTGVRSEQRKRAIAKVEQIKVIAPGTYPSLQKVDDLQVKTKEFAPKVIAPEKALILTEDDISGVNVVDKVELQRKDDAPPVKGWALNLSSFEQLREANNEIVQLKKKGITAELILVDVKGERWYRVRVTGFNTKAEAESYAAKIKQTHSVIQGWVSRK